MIVLIYIFYGFNKYEGIQTWKGQVGDENLSIVWKLQLEKWY